MSTFIAVKNLTHINTILAVIEGDPVDVAIELGITIGKPDQVALVNMANDKRAGGDWEAGESSTLPRPLSPCISRMQF